HIGLTKEIDWDLTLLNNPQPTEYGAYDLIYQLTYHLVYDNDEQLSQYIKRSCEHLKGMKQQGLLLLMYQFLCRDQRIITNDSLFDECESCLVKLYKQLAYQTEILKQSHQSIYQDYQQYYNDLDIIRTGCRCKVVSWEQFSIYYNYEYTSKTVVGYFKLNRCFYSDFKIDEVNHLIETLTEFVGENITFCIEQAGLWFYFKSSCGEANLKRKMNHLVELWYEQLGESYFVSVCLPPYTTDSFEEMVECVRGNFYSMILKPNCRLPYSISFCQKSSPVYNLNIKICNLLNSAYQKGDFKINYTPLYHRDGEDLFGIECHAVLDFHFLLNQLTKEERLEGKKILMIEKEIYQFKLACQYLSENYNQSSKKISLFITFSKQALLNKFISSHILNYLNEYGIEPQQIIVGVNENVLFEQNNRIQKSIKRFRELGINIALDEYGTGSLTGSIRNLNIDYLRISSSLFQYLKKSNNYLNMMTSLLSVCSSKDVKLCYSDIDNESILNLVSDFGIHVVSGSYYQRKLVV
ncbi:MAG: EAL domain-containing protein, partial [Turicibacter sp.]|nr:EAL domain-containing protein [Turicibacter sp.]